TFIIGNLTQGQVYLLNITVQVNNVSNGTGITNNANITFTNSTGAVVTQNISINTTALDEPVYNTTNISVSKGDDVDPINISTLLTYHINITSTGTGMAYNITVNESYPPEIRFQNATPSPVSGTNHSFLIGNLSNGSVFRLNITVLTLNSTNGTVINNTANVSFVNETGFRTNVTDTENTTVENISVAPAPAPEPSPTPSASGGGGGGGGGGGCVDVCDIGESICTSSGRSVCAKTGVCTAYVPSPCASGETCSKGSCNPCEESWLCDDWSACDGGVKTRTCADLNGCSTTKLEPETERACESPISLISLPAPIVKMLETFKAVPWEKPIIIITLMIAAITMLLALILEHELRKRYLKAHWVYFAEAGILVGLTFLTTEANMLALRVLMLVFAVSFAALFLKEAIKQAKIMTKARLAPRPVFAPVPRRPSLFQHLAGIIKQKRKASHEEILTTRTKLEELNQSLKELKLQLKRKK
ncbi:hypothetical protein HY492_01790, partial [Candidatus Woesearchaeota archaeon]|nr:hypothetical protein [Candidatus Woesearchaeota archaeon]